MPCSSASSSAASTPGSGSPTEPGGARPPAGWTASAASRSCRSAPARPRRRRPGGATGRGPAAPSPTRTGAARPSADARPDAARRWYMVGTPKNMVLAGAAAQDRRLVEAVEHDGGGTRGQGAEQPGAQPVHVEERQAEDEAVLGRPVPGRQQRRDAGQEGGVRVHRPLGLAGGPRGVDDQRVVVGPARRPRRAGSARAGARRPARPRRTTGRPARERVRPRRGRRRPAPARRRRPRGRSRTRSPTG